MKILSVSDVITNSSSEVFVIHSKPEFQEEINEEIPEFLKQICDAADLPIDEIMEFETAIDSYIDNRWYYYVNRGDLLINSVYDNSIPYWLMELISEIISLPRFSDKFSGFYAEDLGKKLLPKYNYYNNTLENKEVEIQSIQRHHLG